MHDNMDDSDGADGNDSADESQDNVNDFPGYKSITKETIKL
jgi:hypothetical protein